MNDPEPTAGAAPVQRPSLKRRAVGAGTLAGTQLVFQNVIRLGTNLVMTRLLVPEAFGVMAIVQAVLFGFVMLSDVGINTSVIRSKRGDDQIFLRTAWTLQIARQVVLFLLCLVAGAVVSALQAMEAVPAGSVYNHPDLPPVLAASGVILLFDGLRSMDAILVQRTLRIARYTAIEVATQLAAIPVMILLARWDAGVWALLAGGMLSSALVAFGSHFLGAGFRPGLALERDALHELIHFGKWLLVASGLTFISRVGDRFLLGALMSSAELGVYSIATMLVQVIRLAVEKVANLLGVSVLGEIMRERPNQFQAVYYKIRTAFDGLVFFLTGVLLVASDTLVELLYDARYHAAGYYLALLSVGIAATYQNTKTSAMLVDGYSRGHAIQMGVRVVALAVTFPIGYTLFGMTGGVVAIAVHSLWSAPLLYLYFHRRGWLSWWREIRMLWALPAGMAGGYVLELGLRWADSAVRAYLA